jgi:branched-chain amino acid transport system ATP-binding protein
MMTYALELKDLRKNFGKTEIIRGVNLAVLAGERVAIIGPTGAGKSLVIAQLCKDALERFNGRVIVLQHRKACVQDGFGRGCEAHAVECTQLE